MSSLSYGHHENRKIAKAATKRQAWRDNFKPYMACHQELVLKSVEYRPTKNGKDRWVGQVEYWQTLDKPLTITFWKENIDFLLACGVDTEHPKNVQVITAHSHPKYGLQNVDCVIVDNVFFYRSQVNIESKAIMTVTPEPEPTPIAQAEPKAVASDELASATVAQSLLIRAENTEKAIANASSEAHAANLRKQVNKDRATAIALLPTPKPEPELPSVGDTVNYKGKDCPIIYVLPNGSGGKVWIGIKVPMKTKKGWSTNIITRRADEFEISLQAVA